MKKPNILLITSDQQHFDTIGAFNSEVSTPNLDRQVKEGTTFQRGLLSQSDVYSDKIIYYYRYVS